MLLCLISLNIIRVKCYLLLKEDAGGSLINKHIQMLMLMLIITVIVIPIFNFPSAKAEAAGTWSSLPSMSTARGDLGVAVVNGDIYAIGGTSGGLPLNTNEKYDASLNEWVDEAAMPTPRSGCAIAVYNNEIYVIGGSVGNGFVGNNEVYDPASNTWETKASMPTPRADLSAAVVNNKIYLVGGKIYSNASPYSIETSLTEIYDPSTNTWTTGTPLPTPIYGYASAVMDGKIYVVGGSRNAGPVDSNQVYDPQSDNWTLEANLPELETFAAAAATQNYMAPSRLYFIGGFLPNAYSGSTQVYNPGNNSWSTGAAMPTPRADLGIAVINDVLYAIGGYDGTNWLSTVEQYNPIGYGTVPPQVQITSPENKTYSQVSLAFNVNRTPQWMGYSLDGKANVTVNGQTLLQNLSQGGHSIAIYANDSVGNMGISNIVFFSIDSIPPVIDIILPKNQSYGSTDIQLTVSLNKEIKDLSYSLDGNANVTIIGNVTLPALSNGPHSLTIYATDEVGNSNSQTVDFSIEPFPMITVTAIVVIVIIVVAAGYLFFKRRRPAKTQG
jgi:N-acetylneuraminic acid mutarotase